MWRPTGLKVSPRGEYIAMNGMAGGISMWNMDKSAVGFSCMDMEGPARSRFSENGEMVAIGDAKGKIMIMKSVDGSSLAQIEAASPIRRIADFRESDELVTAVTDTVKLTMAGWEASQTVVLSETGPAPEHYAISPDGEWAAVSFEAKPGKLWHVSTREEIVLPVQGKIADFRFSQDSRYLATACGNGSAWLHELSGRRLIHLEQPAGTKIKELFFVDGGRKVLGRAARQTYVWETCSGKCRQVVQGEMLRTEWVSPDQRSIVLYDAPAQSLKVVDVGTGLELMQHSSLGLHILVEWSANSRMVCIGHNNRGPEWFSLDNEPSAQKTQKVL